MAEASVFPRKVAFWFYAFLLAIGVIFYAVWGAVYGAWNLLDANNAGAYAVTVLLVGFGIVGMLLYKKPVTPPP